MDKHGPIWSLLFPLVRMLNLLGLFVIDADQRSMIRFPLKYKVAGMAAGVGAGLNLPIFGGKLKTVRRFEIFANYQNTLPTPAESPIN